MATGHLSPPVAHRFVNDWKSAGQRAASRGLDHVAILEATLRRMAEADPTAAEIGWTSAEIWEQSGKILSRSEAYKLLASQAKRPHSAITRGPGKRVVRVEGVKQEKHLRNLRTYRIRIVRAQTWNGIALEELPAYEAFTKIDESSLASFVLQKTARRNSLDKEWSKQIAEQLVWLFQRLDEISEGADTATMLGALKTRFGTTALSDEGQVDRGMTFLQMKDFPLLRHGTVWAYSGPKQTKVRSIQTSAAPGDNSPQAVYDRVVAAFRARDLRVTDLPRWLGRHAGAVAQSIRTLRKGRGLETETLERLAELISPVVGREVNWLLFGEFSLPRKGTLDSLFPELPIGQRILKVYQAIGKTRARLAKETGLTTKKLRLLLNLTAKFPGGKAQFTGTKDEWLVLAAVLGFKDAFPLLSGYSKETAPSHHPFGVILRITRIVKGDRQPDVAALFGVTVPTIVNWEEGKNFPQPGFHPKIAAYCEMPLEKLFPDGTPEHSLPIQIRRPA
jgi:DNA-binding XRE family transcriptional regulator